MMEDENVLVIARFRDMAAYVLLMAMRSWLDCSRAPITLMGDTDYKSLFRVPR
jgi:hypothetical protein